MDALPLGTPLRYLCIALPTSKQVFSTLQYCHPCTLNRFVNIHLQDDWKNTILSPILLV